MCSNKASFTLHQYPARPPRVCLWTCLESYCVETVENPTCGRGTNNKRLWLVHLVVVVISQVQNLLLSLAILRRIDFACSFSLSQGHMLLS